MEYEILTESGFKPFKSIRRLLSDKLCVVKFDDGTIITTTLDHRFKLLSGEFIFSKSLLPGMRLSPTNHRVVSVTLDFRSEYVYDIIEVEDVYHYLTDGITSHNCKFYGSSDTLISGWKLQQLAFIDPIEEDQYFKVYEESLPEHTYVATVDCSEGIGKDYSVISLFDISSTPYKHVAVYRNNVIPPHMLIEVLYKLATQFNDAYVIVETNSVGKIVADGLYYDYEYENILTTKTKHNESSITNNSDYIGVRTTKKTKSIGCSSLKSMIEGNILMVYDFDTVTELSTFIMKGTSFQAEQNKNDDIVMTLVLFAWFASQAYFEDLTDVNLRNTIRDNYNKVEENNHLIFGFYDDGSDSDMEVVKMF